MQPSVRALNQDQRRSLLKNLRQDLALVGDSDSATAQFREAVLSPDRTVITDQLLDDALAGTILAIRRNNLTPEVAAHLVAQRDGICIDAQLEAVQGQVVELGTLPVGPAGVQLDDSLELDHGFAVSVPPGEYQVAVRYDASVVSDDPDGGAYRVLKAVSLLREAAAVARVLPALDSRGQERRIHPDDGRLAIFAAEDIPHPQVDLHEIEAAHLAWDELLDTFADTVVTTVPGIEDSRMFCMALGTQEAPVLQALDSQGAIVGLIIVIRPTETWGVEPRLINNLLRSVGHSPDVDASVKQLATDTGRPQDYAGLARSAAAEGRYAAAARNICLARRHTPGRPLRKATQQVQRAVLLRWRRAVIVSAILFSIAFALTLTGTVLALIPALAGWSYALRSLGRNLIPLLQVGPPTADGRRLAAPLLLAATLVAALLAGGAIMRQSDLAAGAMWVLLAGAAASLATTPRALREVPGAHK